MKTRGELPLLSVWNFYRLNAFLDVKSKQRRQKQTPTAKKQETYMLSPLHNNRVDLFLYIVYKALLWNLVQGAYGELM